MSKKSTPRRPRGESRVMDAFYFTPWGSNRRIARIAQTYDMTPEQAVRLGFLDASPSSGDPGTRNFKLVKCEEFRGILLERRLRVIDDSRIVIYAGPDFVRFACAAGFFNATGWRLKRGERRWVRVVRVTP